MTYHEKKRLQLTPGKGLEKKAPKHSEAARIANTKKLFKNTLRTRIVPRNEVIEATEDPFILDSEITQEGIMDGISKKTKKLTPLKFALQLIFPQAILPIEGVYQVLTHLDIISNINGHNSSTNNSFKKALNEVFGDMTKFIADSTINEVKDTAISNIVDNSAQYLDEKQVFEDLTEKLNLDKYTNDFKDFYKTSFKNYLNQEFEKK